MHFEMIVGAPEGENAAEEEDIFVCNTMSVTQWIWKIMGLRLEKYSIVSCAGLLPWVTTPK